MILMRRFCFKFFSFTTVPATLIHRSILFFWLTISFTVSGVSQYNLESQDDVNNFNPDQTYVTGNIIIGDPVYPTDITDISNLSNLTYITGNLLVRNTQLENLDPLQKITSVGNSIVITDNPNLTNINALSQIDALTGRLWIENNYVLENIDGMGALTTIGGDLYLEGNAIADINGLSSLASIGGDLYFRGHPNLTSTGGMSKLLSVGGDITFIFHNALTDLSCLSNITSVNGDLEITDHKILPSLTGMQSISSVSGELKIDNNDAIETLQGLSNLTSIGGDLRIGYNDRLRHMDALSNLSAVAEDLHIYDNPALINIDGLINLTSVGYVISISNNSNLESIAGLSKLKGVQLELTINNNDALTNLNGLSNITGIGRNLQVYNNQVLQDMSGLSMIDSIKQNLYIADNDSLTNLNSFSNLNHVGKNLTIRNNPKLSNCCGIQHLLQNPAFIGGTIEIVNNPSACSSVDEVKDASCGPCWGNELLEFCAGTTGWKPVEGVKNQIKSSDVISINDFLFFDGSMTIDTVELQIVADGEFYVDNIPIPGGGVGKFFLSKGSYDLKFLGADGTITNFLNAEITERTKMFETELSLDKLQLIKTDKEIGLKVTCTIKVPGIAGGCDDGSGTNTEIQLDGLNITTSGISLDGVNVKDLGMYVPKFCLKELKLGYDSQKDILTAGAGVSMPLGEVAGGLKLEEGLIDSIGWKLEVAHPPVFTLGTTTIGISGFFGHISNITKPAIEIELGGIFSDIISDDLYRITASGKTIWPTYFEVAGTGQFMRPIINTLPFQLQGGISLGYNIPNKLLNLKIDGKFGSTDEQNWLMTGDGLLRINHRTDKTKFNGYFNGMMNVTPEVFINEPPMPLPYVISILGLPFSSETKNTIHYGDRKNFFGYITLDHYFLGKYKLNYVIDLTLPMDDPDYFFWQASREEAVASTTRSQAEEIVIPERTEHSIIHIKSETAIPVSILTAPSGKNYTTSSEADLILYSEGVNGKESFWTIMNPEAGTWNIELDNGTQSDEVFYYNTITPDAFEFTTEQDGNTVIVSWDPSGMEAGERVHVLLNDNNTAFNGFRVAEADATDGSVSFEMDHTLPDCQYFLYAELVEGMTMQQVFSDVILYNSENSLAPPQDFKAEYLSESQGFNLSWNPGDVEDITGYVISVIDEVGNDSVYAVLYPTESSIQLLIEDYETKSVTIESYDEEGRVGCPSVIDELSQSCSVASINLREVICPGESFTVGNSVYTIAGDYEDSFTTSEGCDSTVYLSLSIAELDNSVTIEDNKIVAGEENATSYQWINCDSGQDIDGADQRSFTPVETGNYSVRINKDGCGLISDCVFMTTSIKELEKTGIIVYPNPASDEIRILNRNSRKIHDQVYFYDIIGRRFSKTIHHDVINTSDLLSGIYVLLMEVDDERYQTRVLIVE
jgi:hypothetical protein